MTGVASGQPAVEAEKQIPAPAWPPRVSRSAFERHNTCFLAQTSELRCVTCT